MSTVTNPFTFRNGYFPGIANYAPPLLYGYGYVNLTDIGGDAGLSEAIRIWWMVERIKLTPSGTATAGTASATFSQVYQAPDALNTGTALSTAIRGAIVASNSFVSVPASTTEPAKRGIGVLTLMSAAYLQQSFPVGSPSSGNQENGFFEFLIYYNGSRWVLYYRFYCVISITSGTDIAQIEITNNPVSASGAAGPTGTVNFFGYSLAWNSGYILNPSGSTSGIGLTLSYDEWTF